jgi:hypothetical protein
MLRKIAIVLAIGVALTGGSFAHGGGGGGGGHMGGGFGGGFGGSGHMGGFCGGHIGEGGGRIVGGLGDARAGLPGFGRSFAGSDLGGTRGHFDRGRGFDHDRRFDHHRRFDRELDFGLGSGFDYYDYGCNYGYAYYNAYNCYLPSY